MRLRFTIDITRSPKADVEEDEYAPQVDVKGSHVIERSHQDEGNELRTGATEPLYRAGFQPNEETS